MAEKVALSDAAKKLASETGALIYWQNVEEANAQIASDIETLQALN